MTFLFKQADLDTHQGCEAYVKVYGDLSSRERRSDFLSDFSDIGMYTPWAAENPTGSADFLRYLASNELPSVRNLAGQIALDWVDSNPDATVEVLIGSMQDEDPTVRAERRLFVSEVLTDSLYCSQQDKLGLFRLAALIDAYNQTAEPQSPTV
ncbi:MAG: hypothetical protein WBP26_00435 [Candidatus Saccharimonadales bacterium]